MGTEKKHSKFQEILRVTEELNHIKDIDSLLDRILYEARKFTNADAGSIYLAENDSLTLSYIQNDTLFKSTAGTGKYLYTNKHIEINDRSIAGYVAKSGNPVVIEDAYDLDSDLSYCFNFEMDKKTAYRTKSILTLPLKTSQNVLVGVLQIINKADAEGKVIGFSNDDKLYVTYFGNNAAAAIERARLTREIILRMIKMSELRDPKETGAHVNRVASYAIEIYTAWAENRNLPEKEIKKYKDNLRISAMLHDVGKVAISDLILKKPAKLNHEEYDLMKMHTVMGSRLFINNTSDLDMMAARVCLNHHEKWDGSGYPGRLQDIWSDDISMNNGKKGDEIPLEGRIVALADVYDALVSKRAYKEPWTENQVIDYIKTEAGRHFDPELVDSFCSIQDTLKAIRTKYTEDPAVN